MIPESAVKEICRWCDAEFEFIRCSLNAGDESQYNIPESPDKPRTYHWGAVSDSAASEIIRNLISNVDHGAFKKRKLKKNK